MKTIVTKAARSLAGAALIASALAACTGTESARETETAADDASAEAPTIVATTQVWADIASAVTGEPVEAIITGTDIDPHHFEPSAQDLAKISQADYVVANGGHYDQALYTVAEQDRIIHAIPLLDSDSNHDHEHDRDHNHNHAHNHDDYTHDHHTFDIDDIEHAWFVPEKVKQVASEIEETVGGDATSVVKRMDALHQRLAGTDHVHLAMTEPIGAGFLYDTELHDVTPEGYQRASLNHAEPSVQDIAAFIELLESGGLDLLLVNPQSSNSATQRLVEAARANNVPTVDVMETPPAGVDYLDYMEDIANQILDIVAQR